MTFTHYKYGIYDWECHYESDNNRVSFGVSESKNKGDGKWCEKCRCVGFYSWLDFQGRYGSKDRYKPCKACIEKSKESLK